jgi:hypothetical protein
VKKKDALTIRLFNLYGCSGCKNQLTDDFLDGHDRFFCLKGKCVLEKNDKAAEACAKWVFCGDKNMLKNASEPTVDLPFSDEK